MTKTSSEKPAARDPRPGKKRHRRTDEELIADLKRKLDLLKDRHEARQLKESPAIRAAIAVIRAIDRAEKHAAAHHESALRHVLADCRKPLAEHLESSGLRLPKARLPRGRRPKSVHASS
jgi:hypothetical protein